MTNAPLYFWHASQNLDILFVSCVFVSLFSIIAIFLCLHSDLSWICPQSYNNFPIYASFSRVLLNLLIKSPTASLSDRCTIRLYISLTANEVSGLLSFSASGLIVVRRSFSASARSFSVSGLSYHQSTRLLVLWVLDLSYFKSASIDAFTPMWKV